MKSDRIIFNEITKSATLSAVKNPTKIDMNLAYAQQARRIIDRLVGFILTPILWKNIQTNYSKGKSTLSAGRVQSVVNKLIYEKEVNIRNFEKEAYFNIKGGLSYQGDIITIKLLERNLSYKQSIKILNLSKENPFIVDSIKKKEGIENPKAPFITSTLQTEAYNKLNMGSKKCMLIAQKLYEAGHITYMRTDSTAISEDAHSQIKHLITTKWEEKYYRRKNYSNKKNAQEAHECCRPTHIDLLPNDIDLIGDEKRLYDLIWKRTISSQMAPAKKEILEVLIKMSKYVFNSSYEKISFKGFLKVYGGDKQEAKSLTEDSPLNKLKKGDELKLIELIANEKYTVPEPRYNDGSLVKKLEELGIGRPSTYASMINGVIDKNLVAITQFEGEDLDVRCLKIVPGKEIDEKKEIIKYGKDTNKLMTTEMGKTVNLFLEKWVDNIINYTFTANLEKNLDLVAEGKLKWKNVVAEVYNLLVNNDIYKKPIHSVKSNKEKVQKILGINPENGREISVQLGQYGLYIKEKSDDTSIPDKNVSLKEQNIDDVTLEKAIIMLQFPIIIDKYLGSPIMINNGPYGIYIKYKDKNFSVGELSLKDLNKTSCISIINSEKSKSSPEVKSFDKGEIVIMIGKYGPYLKTSKKNYPIKMEKGLDDKQLREKLKKMTKNDCMKIIK